MKLRNNILQSIPALFLLFLFQCVLMVTSDLLVELQHLRVELKSVTIMPGVLCVMTHGELLMPMWSVDNLGTLALVSFE